MPHILTRRHLIGAAAALAVPELAFAQGDLAATPACHDGDPASLAAAKTAVEAMLARVKAAL